MPRHGRSFVYKAIVLGAVALAPVVEEHVETVRPRVTAGEQPPVPEGRATRWQVGHTGAEPAAPSIFVGRRVIVGEAPTPDSRTLRWEPLHSAIADHKLERYHVVTVGDDPSTPEGQVDHRLVGRAGIEDHRLKTQHRVTAGEDPPVPAGQIERWQLEHTGAEPPVAIENIFVRPRVIRGEGPPVPEGVGSRIPVQRPAIADHRLKEQHRVVSGEAPVPGARISRTQVFISPVVVTDSIFVGRRFVQGDLPPTPEGSVSRLDIQRAAVADHRLKDQHRVVTGQAPTPDARVLHWGLEHTGATPPAAVPSIFVGSRHLSTDYYEDARIERWGQFHTGQPIIQIEGGFLGRAFMN